jgi:hypothetical protein
VRDAATAEVLVFLIDHGLRMDGSPPFGFDAGCRRFVWYDYVIVDYRAEGFDCYRAQSTFHRP